MLLLLSGGAGEPFAPRRDPHPSGSMDYLEVCAINRFSRAAPPWETPELL